MSDRPIRLRRARTADAADFARIMGLPEVDASLRQLPMPSEGAWWQRPEAETDPGHDTLHVVAGLDGHPVGSVGLRPQARLQQFRQDEWRVPP